MQKNRRQPLHFFFRIANKRNRLISLLSKIIGWGGELFHILISVNCNRGFGVCFRWTVWLHKDPSIFNLGLVFWPGTHCYWTGTHYFSQDELLLVPGLTKTICNLTMNTNIKNKSIIPYYRKLTLHEIKVMAINAT